MVGVLSLKYGKYSYLTKSYLASLEGEFPKAKCKFTLSDKNKLDNKSELIVINNDTEQIYCFQVIENRDEIEEILEKYYI